MCKLRKKLLLFDYSISKMVEWENSYDKSLTTDECLLRFSGTRLMKCLYSLCLISTKDKKNINETLFSVFDNFVAYVHGPVENDAYNNRVFLLRYTYRNERMYENKDYKPEFEYNYLLSKEKFNASDDILLSLIKEERIEDYQIMIDQSITALMHYSNFPFRSIKELIALTHLELWREACMTSSRKLDLANWEKLKKEVAEFESMIQ